MSPASPGVPRRVAVAGADRSYPEIVPLAVSEFRFPDPQLADRCGIVMAFAVRHGTDPASYDRSVERLRAIDPARVHFGHDREHWSR